MALDIQTLRSVLLARHAKHQEQFYAYEMLHLLVKQHYNGVPKPSEMFELLWNPKRIIPYQKAADVIRSVRDKFLRGVTESAD